MRVAKAMVMTALMAAAGVAHAGDSAKMVLDLRTGPRASGGDETLAFSSLWDGGADATVTVAQDGVAIAENLAGEGERAWSVPYNGTYELTHVTCTNGVAGKVETATFVVTGKAEPPEITNVVATPTGGAWQGQVDISFNVTNDVARGLPDWNAPVLSIVATDNLTGSNYVADVSALSARAPYHLAAALAGSNGTHAVTWDFTAQGIDFSSTNVTFTVAYIRPFDVPGDYCVIDLSGGTNAAHYAVSYLDAEPEGGFTNDLYRTTKLAMRLIGPGTFQMGASSVSDDDNPPHTVTLTRPFYCAVFETTQKQWELVTGVNPSYCRGDTRPVEKVSYDDIRGESLGSLWPETNSVDEASFLGVLRLKTGLDALDLPTEAQWEYACRAGTTNRWCFGDSEDEVGDYMWYNVNSAVDPHEVGTKRPNDWGLYDMHGNVEEWSLDWYGDLGGTCVTNPAGSSSGSARVIRGGSWHYGAYYCTSSYRYGDSPSFSIYYYGFRLVRTLSSNLEGERSAEAAAGAERAGTVCAGTSAPIALVRGASVAFGGKFTLTGRAMAAGEFAAGLYDAGSNQLQTVVNAADGTFEFEAIEYGLADAGKTFSYVVRQVVGTAGGVQYDTTEHTVEVAVSVGADRLVVNVTDNFTALDFANVCPPPEITDVVAEPGAPGSGTVTISFNVTNSPAAVCPGWNAPFLSIVATDNLTGSNYVSNVSALSARAPYQLADALAGSNGTHEVTWDFTAQGIDFSSTNVTFTVAYLRMPDYCVIDLSGGTNAAHYAVSYHDAEPEGGFTNDLYRTTKLAMRLLAPGTFKMGGTADTEITNAFYCAVFETTQRQWELVTGDRPSYFTNETYYATRPVEKVSWNMIRGDADTYDWPDVQGVASDSFVGVLRQKTGLDALDLPTGAQWEYACRAGTTTDFNNGKNLTAFDQCSNMDDIGRYRYNGGYVDGTSLPDQDCATNYGTVAVGSYMPNGSGLYDMHGNVLEWCLDSAFVSHRMLRGGSWDFVARFCISSNQSSSDPSDAYNYCGFRLVRTLSDNLEGERSAEAVAGAERAGTVCAGTASKPIRVGKDFTADDIALADYAGAYDGEGHGIGIETNAIEGLVLRYAVGEGGSPGGLAPPSGGHGVPALPDWGDVPPTFTDVTNVTVWVEANAPGYFAFTTNATVTITQRAVTLTSGSAEKVYDGTPVTCADVLVGGDGFAPGEGATFEVTGSQTHFGSSENFFTYALNDGTSAWNYEITTSNGTLTVTKATNAWTADPSLAGWTYGETAGVPDMGGAAFGTATVTYGGGQGAGRPTDAGDYTATFTVAGTEDYDGLTFEVPFTIARATFADGDIVLTDYAGTYDGEGHGVGVETNAIDGLVLRYAVGEGGSPGGLALPSGGHGVPALPDWSDTPPTFTDATNVTVWVEASAPNYETVTNSATVKITARQVTLTSGSASKTYDGTPVLCADIHVGADGFAQGEGATFDVTGSQTDVGSSGNTFTYALNEGTLAGNYEITMVEGTLTVEPAESEPQPEPQPEPPAGRRVPWPTDAPFRLDRMTTYNGYLLDANANDAVVGVIAVKAGKPSKNTGTSRLTVTIRLTGQKAITVRGRTVDGTFRAMAGGRALDIALGLHSLSGAFGSYLVDGSRDMFSARDADSKSRAAQALSRWKGNYVAAWQAAGATDAPYNTLSITVKKKGRVTVKGTLANGTRVSANTRLLVGGLHRRLDTGSLLLVGEKECAVAVSWAKKGSPVACLLWFGEDGTVSCESLNDGSVAVAAPVGAGLAAGATLRIDQAAVAAAFPGISVERSFPGGVPAKLSLRYGKDGTFGGSFKVYVDSGVSFRQKTVKVSGVVLDGIGYGVAYVKNIGDWKITVE